MIVNAQILKPFDASKEIIVMSNACQEGVGAVLFNEVNGKWITVSCASATLSPAER